MALLPAGPVLLGSAPHPREIRPTVPGLRRLDLVEQSQFHRSSPAFPDCAKDPSAHAVSVPAGATVDLAFGEVPKGRYAISLFHDENGNGRLDKKLLMPSEGYGFSRDAPVRFGPPRFAAAAFAVDGGEQRQTIRMRYMF